MLRLLCILAVPVFGLASPGCASRDPAAQSLAWARSVRPLVADDAVIQRQRLDRERASDEFARQLNVAEEAKVPYAGVAEYSPNWPQISARRDAGPPGNAATAETDD